MQALGGKSVLTKQLHGFLLALQPDVVHVQHTHYFGVDALGLFLGRRGLIAHAESRIPGVGAKDEHARRIDPPSDMAFNSGALPADTCLGLQ